MSTKRTAYHVIFYRLLKARGPAGFTFQFEQPLTLELQRADLIIVRKTDGAEYDETVVLPQLWPLLPSDTIAEYKSPTGGFRSGDLARLLGYAGQYHCENIGRLQDAHHLALVLVVASITPTLERELKTFHWMLVPLGGGYYRTNAQPYPLYIVSVDEVARAERDVLLDLVGHRTMASDEADVWLVAHAFSTPEEPDMDKLEDYDELLDKALARMSTARRLKGIPPRDRLEGIPPEERLEDLPPEKQILALGNEVLAGLSQSYLDTLPADVRAEIRRRLHH